MSRILIVLVMLLASICTAATITNPATESLVFTIDETLDPGATLIVCDLHGYPVIEWNYETEFYEAYIITDPLPSGTYVCAVFFGGEVIDSAVFVKI